MIRNGNPWKTLHNLLLVLMTVVIAIGGSYLYFVYFVDGVYYKPLLVSYDKTVKTDKTIYYTGDDIFISWKFCAGRDITNPVKIYWSFVNNLIFNIPSSTEHLGIKKGCHQINKFVAKIPHNLPLGTYYLDGMLEAKVNKTRNVLYQYVSNEFQIIK